MCSENCSQFGNSRFRGGWWYIENLNPFQVTLIIISKVLPINGSTWSTCSRFRGFSDHSHASIALSGGIFLSCWLLTLYTFVCLLQNVSFWQSLDGLRGFLLVHVARCSIITLVPHKRQSLSTLNSPFLCLYGVLSLLVVFPGQPCRTYFLTFDKTMSLSV